MPRTRAVQLSDFDVRFIVDSAAPEAADKERLILLVREDDAFRKAMVGDIRLFQRVEGDQEVFVRISPGLYFEILLRRTLGELQTTPFTLERAGSQKVAVFDTKEVVALLSQEAVLDYLAGMLASFTRNNSYTKMTRVKPRVWRRIRVNDMDVDSLIKLCADADPEERISYYKRIGDVCLFILGIYPEFAPFDYRYPGSSEGRPAMASRVRRGVQEYEDEGRRFYKLAGEHPTAKSLEMAEVFLLLYQYFTAAKKPLNFISAHYLSNRQNSVFEVS